MKEFISNIFSNVKRQIINKELEAEFQSTSWLINLNGTENIGKLHFENNNKLLLSTINGLEEGFWTITNSGALHLKLSNFNYLLNYISRNSLSIILNIDLNNDYVILINERKAVNLSIDSILKSYNSTSNLQYYVLINSRIEGPFTIKVLKQMVSNGTVNKMCFVKNNNESNFSQKTRVKDIITL